MSEEGSDDSPPRPKRKIKRVVVMSSSESESDESISVAGTRRKRLRVISDEEASDTSGSSVVLAGTRRRRTLPKLRDSEAESDISDWSSDRPDTAKPVPSASKPASGFASDSSEGNSDKCSICLLRFKEQQVGTPESCEHIFCLDCITEWSKNVNTCPVDRMTFNSIIVKACVGGRVLRTDPVKVLERRPSVEALVVEDPTLCEICGSSDDEETMLLCDGCDLGYHMQCLTPPLSEIPADQWLCPNCYVSLNGESNLLEDINLSEVEDLLDGVVDIDLPIGPRASILRQQRNVRRSSRTVSHLDQPSTSRGMGSNRVDVNELPVTSRSSRSSLRSASGSTNRRQAVTKRRKYKRRRTKTVIIEYEVQENGKFPITKRVKKKVRRRRIKKRQPRTAARRSYVRASVRAKLATLKSDQRMDMAQATSALSGVCELAVRRHRAGIPSLSLYGNPHELDYFSDNDDNTISEGASTAVATRPTSSILSAYRHARRKMINVPSPPHATSAPDILSNILESQTLLHSKNAVISISVDGNVDYKLQSRKQNSQKQSVIEPKSEEKVDLSKANEAVRNVPSYPGQNRGGGWGGGYRGNYHREQNSNNFNNRGGNYENNYSGNYNQSRQGNAYNYQNNNMRRDDAEYYDNYSRRPQQYSHNEDPYFDRSRRPGPMENNRSNNYLNHQRPNEQSQGRYSLGPSWQSYGGGGPPGPALRQDVPPTHNRHSFGGFENPVDMRMGHIPPTNTNTNSEVFPTIEAPRQEKIQPHAYQSLPEPQPYQPLPEAPVFNYPKISEVEKSEDEKSDSGLVIDTEKYDPTEPTHDDDSAEDEPEPLPAPPAPPVPTVALPSPTVAPPALPAPPEPPLSLVAPPSSLVAPPSSLVAPPSSLAAPPAVQSILAGLDPAAMNVPPNILDTAVRQVLKEHRNLIVPSAAEPSNDRSDDDSDGDCPNFSIYSATSVHIANNSSTLTDEMPREQPQDSLEDLVQEDDETPPSTSPVPTPDTTVNEMKIESNKSSTMSLLGIYEADEKKKSEEEYKEKVSKRCPITTNTRNPIKIKLNTSSLIKRQVSLYDDEEASQEAEATEKTDPASDTAEQKLNCSIKSPKKYSETSEKFDVQIEHKNKTPTKRDKSPSPINKNVVDMDNSLHKREKNQTETSEIDVRANKEVLCQNKNDDDQCEKLKSNEDLDVMKKKVDDSKKNAIESNEEEGSDDDDELPIRAATESPRNEEIAKIDDNMEKMTESISETEDERSYTPCLDENKSTKDASFETEKDKGLEGLDTEMISEDEGNEMFSENERAPSEVSRVSPLRAPHESEEGEIEDKKKEAKKTSPRDEGAKKKKKKDSKKETKDKSKGKKKGEISFKKLSKSGKERNYRERDKNEKRGERERRDSGDRAESRQRRRKEKRKDLERYDVRTVVTEKRRKQKDPFGRDVSPRGRSPSLSPPPRSPSASPARRRPASRPRRSLSRLRRSPSRTRRSLSRGRRSLSRGRRSLSRIRRSPSKGRRSVSRARRSGSRGRRSPSRIRRSPSPPRRSPSRGRRSPPTRRSALRRGSPLRGRSPSRVRVSPARARRSASTPRRRSGTPRPSPRRRSPPRRKRRRSGSRAARRRSASPSPPRRAGKKKKRTRSARRAAAASPVRKRRRSASRQLEAAPPEPASRPPSPRTPPPEPELERALLDEPERAALRRRRDPDRQRRRAREATGPSKEVFTSGDNILVSVSFKEQERGEDGDRRRRRESRRDRRRRRRAAAAPEIEVAKPVAIIDLDRSPFRELTPSPKNIIVLSDSDHGEREGVETSAPPPPAPEPAPEPAPPALGPKTPPEPAAPEPVAPEPVERPASRAAAPASEPNSPDAYDPFEPTRSASASPASASPAPEAAPSPPRALITLEAAQRSNLSADEVLDRRPLTPVEKVMALLQSTRDASPEPSEVPETTPAPAPRIVLPSPTRAVPKLFPGKPSPIKSNPVKPMQALRLPRLPSDGGASPYSPGSSDFGELFEPPPRRSRAPSKVPVRLDRKKSKMQVGVKIDDENLKILDDLPSSAVEMQVKSKFLKKLNRQERVVEEVKLVLKPHYNKKRVTKEQYKDILRRAVPKICHNKSGEINPTKIQALVEAYVKKFRKKHKLGIA